MADGPHVAASHGRPLGPVTMAPTTGARRTLTQHVALAGSEEEPTQSAVWPRTTHYRGGRRTIEMKNSSIWRTTLENCSKSTGLAT